jgi:malate synthase
VSVSAADLIQFAEGPITEQGLRTNISVAIQYIEAWLGGQGAVPIFNLMEDAATAEISRSQVWQWIHHGRTLEDDGTPITPDLVRRLEGEELERIRTEIGDDEWFEAEGRPEESRALFEEVALADELAEFLTIPAYEQLD